MANLSVNCSTNFGLLGTLCKTKNDFKMVSDLLLTPEGFSFPSAAEFSDKAKYDEAIKAGDMHVLSDVSEIDNQSEETKFYTAPSGKKTKTKEAVAAFVYRFILALGQHKELQKFDGERLRYFKIDAGGNILGWQDTDGTIKGFLIDNFSTENMTEPTGAEEVAFSPLNVTEADRNEWNTKGVFVNPSWLTSSLKSLAPVEVIFNSVTATDINIQVGFNSGIDGDTGATEYIGIKGLEVTDFVLKDATGSVVAITSVTESGNGYYVLEVASFTTGTIDLVEPPVMSEGLFIKSTGAAIIS